MPAKHLIYGLLDPVSGELRYVGRSSSGMRRPNGHASNSALKLDDYTHRWVRSLVGLDLRPVAECLEEWPGTGDPNDWLNETERFYISYFRYLGCPLTNTTDGGMGTRGYKQSPETIAKRVSKTRGMKRSPEQRQRISEGHKGLKPSANSAFGKDCPPWNKGKEGCFSDETIELMRQAKVGTHRPDTIKQKISDNSPRKNPIRCVNDGREFDSLKSATQFYGLKHYQAISRVLSGVRNHVHGLSFKYVDKA